MHDTALRALLEKSFKYTGLLGSRKKIEKMFNDYKKEKISSALLNNIKAPIGIFIKSETVHEIAVSIAAEIISIKNSVQ
jgi:xanthine dehydrogenase accessory factor